MDSIIWPVLDAIESKIKFLFLLYLWALLASPFVIAAMFAGRFIRRRRPGSLGMAVTFALVVAVLIAPVPTPIITIFMPNGLAFFSSYYADIFSGNSFYAQLRPWVLTSLLVTWALACPVTIRYVGGR